MKPDSMFFGKYQISMKRLNVIKQLDHFVL